MGHLNFVTLAMLAAMLASVIFFSEPSGWAWTDSFLLLAVHTSTIATVSVVIFLSVRALAVRVALPEAALAAEHARSEALLGNLLPQDIARRLKANTGEVIADGMPAVTLLFAESTASPNGRSGRRPRYLPAS